MFFGRLIADHGVEVSRPLHPQDDPVQSETDLASCRDGCSGLQGRTPLQIGML